MGEMMTRNEMSLGYKYRTEWEIKQQLFADDALFFVEKDEELQILVDEFGRKVFFNESESKSY